MKARKRFLLVASRGLSVQHKPLLYNFNKQLSGFRLLGKTNLLSPFCKLRSFQESEKTIISDVLIEK